MFSGMLSGRILLMLNLNRNEVLYELHISFLTPPFLPYMHPLGLFCAFPSCFPAFFEYCCFSCPLAPPWAFSRTTFLWGRRRAQEARYPQDCWGCIIADLIWEIPCIYIVCSCVPAPAWISKRRGMELRGKMGYQHNPSLISSRVKAYYLPFFWTISLVYLSDSALKSRRHI